MELSKLANNLRYYIPKELYQLEPNMVTFFVPKDGVNQRTIMVLEELMRYFRFLYHDNNVHLFFFPTENEALIDKMATRIPQGEGLPDKVVIGTWETVAGFASQLFDEDVNYIVEKRPRASVISRLGISATNLPIIIYLAPRDNPINESISIDSALSDDPHMELLQKRPETEKEKKALVGRYEQKLKKMLWECAYLAINIDVKGVIEEVEINKNKTKGYGLSLQMIKPSKVSDLIDCKIFVGDGLELKVTPIRKAIYLAFLTLQDGLVIESVTPAFTKTIQKIYRLLPDKEEKDFEENTDRLGIMVTDIIQTKTLRGYMSDINSAIAKLVPNGLIAIELSIEGLKDGAFKVIRSTPEIRNQIIEAFNL